MKKFILLLAPTILLLTLAVGLNVYLTLREPTKAKFIQQRRHDLAKPVYPAFAAQELLTRQLVFGPDRNIIPLTGPAHSETVFCKEAERYLQYQSDRFGFHNPDSIWDLPQWKAVFVGDSFVQGACIHSEKNFVSLFQKSKGPTGNLGSYGNGPLGQLASLMEYAKSKRPEKVFWVYMQNDLFVDLNLESRNSIFLGYLKGQTQDLISNQALYEPELRKYLDQVLKKELENKDWRRFISFQTLLRHFDLKRQAKARSEPKVSLNSDFLHSQKIDWDLYRTIVEKAVQLVQSWGGEFHFVILPNSEMLSPKHQSSVKQLKQQLKMTVAGLDLEMIDLHQQFSKTDRPLKYFNPLGFYYGHFNEEGYQKAAQFLLDSQSSPTQRKAIVGR